jgi:hypothetical protein
MDSRRLAILRNLIMDLYALEKLLLDKKVGCSHACRSMHLGDLIQATKECGLYPRPSAPFDGLAVHQVIRSLRKAPLSKCFSSKEDSPAAKHSGQWCLIAQSSSLGGRQQASSGGPFSTTVIPQAGRTSPRLFGPSATEKNNLPQDLVQHQYCLSDLMVTILPRVEAWMTGLELPDYLKH